MQILKIYMFEIRDVEVASSNLVTPIITESLYLQALERKKSISKSN